MYLKFLFIFKWTILKSLLNLLQYCFWSTFWFFGREVCGVLTTRDWIRTPCIGWRSLHPWTSRQISAPLFLHIFSHLKFLSFLNNWSIVGLQCFSFKCIPNWCSCTCIYIYIYIFRFFSFIGYCKILSIIPCVTQLVLVVCLFYIKYCVNPKLLSYPYPSALNPPSFFSHLCF